MPRSIPARRFVGVTPSALQAGGISLGMDGVLVDNSGDTSIPIGTLQPFPSSAAIDNWYGPTSVQAKLAGIYFAGFVGADALPSVVYFTQYNTASVAAYLRSAPNSLTLLQIQSLSGTISVAVDGISIVSASINLASATSFSNAAALIQTGLQGGTPTNTITCTYDSLRKAFVITSSTTGASSTVAYPTDSSLSPSLGLTQAAGAVLSQGAIAATPAGAMDAVVANSQNWATFMTVQDPDSGAAGGPIKQAFAAWNADQDEAYMYVAYDSDAAPSQGSDPDCFAQVIKDVEGTFPIWSATQGAQVAAFVCGLTASIQFNVAGGRTDYAFRASPSLTPDVVDDTIFMNVTGTPDVPGNGYNCYGDYATRTQQFQWLQRGTVTGSFAFADSLVNQIFWNSQFQTDFSVFRSQIKSIPYVDAGFAAARQALAGDIQLMGAFGAWVAGVQLSTEQQQEVNAFAGINIAQTLQQVGYYLLIADPGPIVRQQRGSPIAKFLYTDGGSWGAFSMSSVDVE